MREERLDRNGLAGPLGRAVLRMGDFAIWVAGSAVLGSLIAVGWLIDKSLEGVDLVRKG